MDEKMKKKLLYVLGAFVGFIVFMFLISSCTPNKYSFEKLEKKMLSVAKDYYKNKEKELPMQNKDTRTYTLKKMISDGKIEELTELFDDDSIKCDGNVTVTNNNGYYLYSPYLNCGEKYKTSYLREKIIEDSLVENGVGLYEERNEYIYKGEVKNNYIKLNDKIYRILRINDDGFIKVISNESVQTLRWDDRYNPDRKMTSGVNEYEYNTINSRFKDSLNEYYNNLPDKDKEYISTQSVCIGKRTPNDITKDGSSECSVIAENQAVTAITVYEYLQASLDNNCSYTEDKNCMNYNWLSQSKESSWTITANMEDSFQVFFIRKYVSHKSASSHDNYYPIVLLTDKLIYESGTGTEEDPYIVK